MVFQRWETTYCLIIYKEYHVKELPADLVETWDKAALQLQSLGAKVIEVSLENTANALPAYYIIAPAEATSNLARYDGIRYGERFRRRLSETFRL